MRNKALFVLPEDTTLGVSEVDYRCYFPGLASIWFLSNELDDCRNASGTRIRRSAIHVIFWVQCILIDRNDLNKSMEWFLYDNGLCHERANAKE